MPVRSEMVGSLELDAEGRAVANKVGNIPAYPPSESKHIAGLKVRGRDFQRVPQNPRPPIWSRSGGGGWTYSAGSTASTADTIVISADAYR